jgi:hypothetical protein
MELSIHGTVPAWIGSSRVPSRIRTLAKLRKGTSRGKIRIF